MIAIKIDFPAGRWHATAWGSHVNEGVVEWPPCPWRLCRALIAAWHWKHRKDEAVLRALVGKLSAEPPSYRLPNASTAHTRHYMPVIEGKKETKTKVFDAFVHVSAGESLWIRWDVDLTDEESALLAELLESLSYLGRAESLISATLQERLPVNGDWSRPLGQDSARTHETIRLLAPQQPGRYADWASAQAALAKAGKSKSKKRTDTLPPSLFDALQTDTADWKKEGWNLPPGARWLEYSRPRDSLKVAPAGTPPPRRQTNPPTVARFALASKVQPSITQSLGLAERVHQALCKLLDGIVSPAITGMDENSKPLTGNAHAYFLPECDAHGYITHLTIYSPLGFNDETCRAYARLSKVWGHDNFDVRLVLLATGQPSDFAKSCPYFQKSKIWRSLTPFVPVRHAKATSSGKPKLDPETGLQIGSPAHDCQRLLSLMYQKQVIASVSSADSNGSRIQQKLRDIPCLDFQSQRRLGKGTRAGSRGYALQIEFREPQSLPVGLGYAAHFGLGLFAPAD